MDLKDRYVLVIGSVRQTELTNLREFVNYNITVFACTEKGDGLGSDLIGVRSDQDSKYFILTAFYVLLNAGN